MWGSSRSSSLNNWECMRACLGAFERTGEVRGEILDRWIQFAQNSIFHSLFRKELNQEAAWSHDRNGRVISMRKVFAMLPDSHWLLGPESFVRVFRSRLANVLHAIYTCRAVPYRRIFLLSSGQQAFDGWSYSWPRCFSPLCR